MEKVVPKRRRSLLASSGGRRVLSKKEFAEQVPKIELHVHLDGAFDTNRLFYWSQRYVDELPETTVLPWNNKTIPVKGAIRDCRSVEALKQLVTCPVKGRSLEQILECFYVFLPIVRGRADVLEDLAFHFCMRQAQSNVVYTEVRYSPHEFVDEQHPDKLTPRQVVECVTRGLERGMREYSIRVNQLLCCVCCRPEWASEVVSLAMDLRDKGIVGVDIASGEQHFDSAEFGKAHEEALTRAHTWCLHITVHAAEAGPAENALKAANTYHARRIGHGYRVLENTAIYKQLNERALHYEMCPMSSRCTHAWQGKDWANHPIKKFIKDGNLVSINSDDPSVFNTTLSEEYLLVIEEIGLTVEQIQKSLVDAANGAFCNEDHRKDLHRLLEVFFEQYTF